VTPRAWACMQGFQRLDSDLQSGAGLRAMLANLHSFTMDHLEDVNVNVVVQ
jgi:hypothetical protein